MNPAMRINGAALVATLLLTHGGLLALAVGGVLFQAANHPRSVDYMRAREKQSIN
jgi:hypothetical protein